MEILTQRLSNVSETHKKSQSTSRIPIFAFHLISSWPAKMLHKKRTLTYEIPFFVGFQTSMFSLMEVLKILLPISAALSLFLTICA